MKVCLAGTLVFFPPKQDFPALSPHAAFIRGRALLPPSASATMGCLQS